MDKMKTRKNKQKETHQKGKETAKGKKDLLNKIKRKGKQVLMMNTQKKKMLSKVKYLNSEKEKQKRDMEQALVPDKNKEMERDDARAE